MSDNAVAKLTLESLRQMLQQSGYQVEVATDRVDHLSYLRSTSNGVSFAVHLGNPVPGDAHGFADAAFTAAIHVQGDFPFDIINNWNAQRRFCRLQRTPTMIVLCMDVSVAGGVTPDFLLVQIATWGRLIGELITYLQEPNAGGVLVMAPREPVACAD
ncbi:YbjN domain-containing protein [Bradyrhizobium sp. S69]|uniref:YbjN domain-containing protein n=1 Tax=Bradyrhizobium sp. S69 TaxID=1641856 RepID=UPI00131B6921|nr:YbjN domain-containing protein [Bradyrhizobium sp. S69]